MLRSLALTACAAWISAVLFVSPIVAALECRRCCSASESSAAPSCCAAKSHATCCLPGKASAPSGREEGCPSCPKCLAKRPVPATVSGAGSWKLPLLEAVTVPAWVVDELPDDRPSIASGREIADRSTPPLRILFCTWRE